MDKSTAQKAVKWWADHLRGSAKLDNGDDSFTGAMTFALGKMLQDTENAQGNPGDADRFEHTLAKLLETKDGKCITIGVDYGPDHILLEAAERSGVNLGMTRLPWKTTMWITDDTVKVACGYGASAVEL